MGKIRKANLERFREHLKNNPRLDEAYRQLFKKGFDEATDTYIQFIGSGKSAGELVGVVVALNTVVGLIYDECREKKCNNFPAAVDFFTAELKKEDEDGRNDHS
jgi:hypothetical protein